MYFFYLEQRIKHFYTFNPIRRREVCGQ